MSENRRCVFVLLMLAAVAVLRAASRRSADHTAGGRERAA